jgi:D-alanine-D-alanine ligase
MKNPNQIRVGVLFGGKSGEHEVSLASARNVMNALQEAGYTVVPIGITRTGRWLTSGDPLALLSSATVPTQAQTTDHVANGVAENGSLAATKNELAVRFFERLEHLPQVDIIFPVLHGPFGEDGTVQGLLEMANLPYVGCGVLASAAGMDKVASKLLFQAAGLPQVPYQVVFRHIWREQPETVTANLEAGLAYPMFVKPANLGSSVGISKAVDVDSLVRAIDLASQYDRKIIVEQAVPNAREIEVSILGNEEPIASVPGEVVPGNEFYDYAAKYLDDTSQLLIPAPIAPAVREQIQDFAIQAFKALDGAGLARVDFLLGEEDDIYLNEVNTLPGFTRISMYPKLWEASGIPPAELAHRLIQLGFQRYQERQENRTG